jgi:hypothetical protein
MCELSQEKYVQQASCLIHPATYWKTDVGQTGLDKDDDNNNEGRGREGSDDENGPTGA